MRKIGASARANIRSIRSSALAAKEQEPSP
jgi:hypothetical protein